MKVLKFSPRDDFKTHAEEYIRIKKEMEALKKELASHKEALIGLCEEENTEKYGLRIQLKNGRTRFDSKTFMKENPDLHAKYSVTGDCTWSITLTPQGE